MLIIGLIFFIPRNFYKKSNLTFSYIFNLFKSQFIFIVIILGVVILHLIEVNIIDPYTTILVGYDFANIIKGFEGDIVYSLSNLWTPYLIYFFVIIYIAIYPFTLWFSVLYFILNEEKKAMKTLAYGLFLIYIFALPFYLFMPITNVYTFYNLDSALETVIPSVENFFYSTTTYNNCLPSLHTAMTILIAYSVSLTDNKRLKYFSYFTMITVIIAVLYLSIHWLTDVFSGAILSLGVIFILRRYMRENEKNA